MSQNSEQEKYVKKIRLYFPEVDRVADSTRPIKIEVKKCDVTAAKKKSHNACAMARACERQEHLDGALISPSVSYLVKGSLAVRYKTPASVGREIVSFDRHRDFRCGDYQLSAMPPSTRMGARPNNRRGSDVSKKHHRQPLVSRPSEGMRGVLPAK